MDFVRYAEASARLLNADPAGVDALVGTLDGREWLHPQVTDRDVTAVRRFLRGLRPVFDAADAGEVKQTIELLNALMVHRRRTRRPHPGLGALRRASASRGSSSPARAGPARGGTLGPAHPGPRRRTPDVGQGDVAVPAEHRTVHGRHVSPDGDSRRVRVYQEHGGPAVHPGLARRPCHHDQEGGPVGSVIRVLRPLIRHPPSARWRASPATRVRAGSRLAPSSRRPSGPRLGRAGRGSAPAGRRWRRGRAGARCPRPGSASTASGPNNE